MDATASAYKRVYTFTSMMDLKKKKKKGYETFWKKKCVGQVSAVCQQDSTCRVRDGCTVWEQSQVCV